MTADTIRELAEQAADVIEALHDGDVTRVEFVEMADGSRRHGALIDVRGELALRVTTPAPADAPAWASVFARWRVEARYGSSWDELSEGEASA